MKHLVGKTPTKEVSFCEVKVKIKKLSVDQVFEVQRRSKANSEIEGDDAENAGMELLQYVCECSVEGAAGLTKDEFRSFPVDELSKLSNAILEWSGLGNVPTVK
jgi:hypothetical protein